MKKQVMFNTNITISLMVSTNHSVAECNIFKIMLLTLQVVDSIVNNCFKITNKINLNKVVRVINPFIVCFNYKQKYWQVFTYFICLISL